MKKFTFANRDQNWLSFNKQVLMEALAQDVPLRERINFLAIFSSNLDEFYRVRYPIVQLIAQATEENLKDINSELIKNRIDREIAGQQVLLGRILQKTISSLRSEGILWIYNRKIPSILNEDLAEFFRNKVLGKLQLITDISYSKNELFAPNSQIFLALDSSRSEENPVYIPLPTPSVPRLIPFQKGGKTYVIFLEDLIKHELSKYRPDLEGYGFFSFKVNRDAEMNLDENHSPRLAKRIKKEIKRREIGIPTRLLIQTGMPEVLQKNIQKAFRLESASVVRGGAYHQLHDLFGFPLGDMSPIKWEVSEPSLGNGAYFLDEILFRDKLIHPPYHTYNPILRLFNEAAIHPDVTEIFLTIYRVAKDSKILQALITAALNGKKVTVFVELKARFDEENNLEWSDKMKAAGIRIKYSIPKLKVHAKAALIKLKSGGQVSNIALLGTGNFNESTGKIYTDHFLFTSQKPLCKELEQVFKILVKSPEKPKKSQGQFDLLWVGKFNLKEKILEMIQLETQAALAGEKAEIFLKMNNLEEEDVIRALYQASQSGVSIRLLIRGICRLIPGRKGQSERITVKRIVDHYLEHGRVFSFYAGGEEKIYLGSADWMDRNLNRRIEICFPVLDKALKTEVQSIMEIQWLDNQKAQTFPKTAVITSERPHRSQAEICDLIAGESKSRIQSKRIRNSK